MRVEANSIAVICLLAQGCGLDAQFYPTAGEIAMLIESVRWDCWARATFAADRLGGAYPSISGLNCARRLTFLPDTMNTPSPR